MASDDDLLIFRRFSVLNTRVLLSLQDKVCELEHELLELDQRYSGKDAEINDGTFRRDVLDRAELLGEIESALSRYSEYITHLPHSRLILTLSPIHGDSLVLQRSALWKYPTAPQRDVKNINNWHYNHGDQAIANEERQYLQKTSDLVSITEKDKTPIRQFIDSSRRLRTLPIWRQLNRSSSDDSSPQHGDSDKDVAYYSDKRINDFTSLTIVFIGVAMLLTPVWILQALQAPTTKLAVITIFILTFLVTLS
ncbi:hypothetical protein PG994_007072 [Apiospora phragmitis]|uniref:DUF6594 domain-containing protein n=1 Tax=Apiospora phragmitis TaxID=2905665 RepID=A0ABR1UZT0_9PEZI